MFCAMTPETIDNWKDLKERLERAAAKLEEAANWEREDEEEAARLAGKVEGVRLALDYIRGYA